ncbi:MAG: Oxidoreductase, short chain dehydrogenase/reductase family [Novosphingobium sp.]|nr:Oxidoreductase, short chain dehydrogenase/reductase family [Novosphingobium sp.]
MTDLAAQTVVVTGAGSGIGRAIAREWANKGARIVVSDLSEAAGLSVASEIVEDGGQAVAVPCDVCDPDAIAALKSAANSAFGRVTALVANAGAVSFEPLGKMSEQDIRWIIEVNLMGVTSCITAFLPDIAEVPGGHVVATASAAGLLPHWIPYHTPYSSAKAGIIGLMLNLRLELLEAGVGATVLCPFGVATNMHQHNQAYRPQRFGGPRQGAVALPGTFFDDAALSFRTPEEVAVMTLEAVAANRPMVVTDASQRDQFTSGYAKIVLDAFDAAAAFDERQITAASGQGQRP